MGDRANCIVLQNTFGDDRAPVWLYTHWGGYELLEDVQAAIAKRQRWDDTGYLTRIIFDQMSKGHQGEVSGFSISTGPDDNSYDYVVVDPKCQEVRMEDPRTRVVNRRWSFEEFCNISDTKMRTE